jgi:aryl-alcohol dehydrogenase-like predicted oxidoreductase
MDLRPLGTTGLTVSALGFGCGAVGGLMVRGDHAEQQRVIARAIDSGIRYMDTAPSYGDGLSEQNLGRVLQSLGTATVDGQNVVIGTKVRVDSATVAQGTAAVRQAVRQSAEASLRRLQRDRVHLLQLHNRISPTDEGPNSSGLSADQVLGPVADALHAVRDAGLAEHVGITATGDASSIKRILTSGKVATAQSYFNALNPSAGYPNRTSPAPTPTATPASTAASSSPLGGTDFAGLIDTAAQNGVGIIVIRPLAAGAVAGTTQRHANASSMSGTGGGVAGERFEEDVARAQALARLATDLGLDSPVELAFRFALSKPGVSTVLVGFSDGSQFDQALKWANRGPLTPSAVQQVLALTDTSPS